VTLTELIQKANIADTMTDIPALLYENRKFREG